MDRSPLSRAVRRIVRAVAPESGEDDFILLERFARGGDDEAFEILLERHGPMVWRTCQRVVGQAADAEDAFQAAFLVLCRKANGIRRRESLAGWLHRVAFRIALRVKAQPNFRSLDAHHPLAGGGDPADAVVRDDLRHYLDKALQLLPEKNRLPLILCCLEGKSLRHAAAELGWPVGTLVSRLEHGKELLRARLVRADVGLSAAALATLLTQEGSARTMPLALAETTVKLKSLFLLGEAAQTSAAAVKAIALAKGALQTMLLTKIKMAVFVVAAVGLLGVGLRAMAPGAHTLPEVAVAAAAPQANAKDGAVAAKPEPPPRTDRFGDPLPAGAVARLGTVRLRIGSDVRGNFLCFLPDNKTIVAPDAYRYAMTFWDAGTGKLVREIDTSPIWIVSFAVAPNGKYLAVAGHLPREGDQPMKRVVRIIDLATGKEIRMTELKDDTYPYAMVFTPDGKYLMSRSEEARVRVEDAVSGIEIRNKRFGTDSDASMTLSADGSTLAVGGEGLTLYLWKWNSKQEPLMLKTDGRLAVGFSPNGNTLACSGYVGGIKLFDVTTGRRLPFKADAPENIWISALVFSPDGKLLAANVEGHNHDDSVTLWDAKTGKVLRKLSTPGESMMALAISADARWVAAASDIDVHVWNLRASCN